MHPIMAIEAGSAATDAGASAFSALCCFAFLIPVAVGVGLLVLWIVALVDVLQRGDWEFPNAINGQPSQSDRIVWLLIVLLVGWIGAVVYYFMVMKPYPRRAGRPLS